MQVDVICSIRNMYCIDKGAPEIRSTQNIIIAYYIIPVIIVLTQLTSMKINFARFFSLRERSESLGTRRHKWGL